MTMRRWLVLTLITISILVASISTRWLTGHQEPKRITPSATLDINGHAFKTQVAKTAEDHIQGLSGITYLASNEAMYFPYNQAQNVTFWMKDMLIPIDIIWVQADKIAGIHESVPPPAANTVDQQLIRYNSPVDKLDGVVEIAAGRSQQLGLAVGQIVNLSE